MKRIITATLLFGISQHVYADTYLSRNFCAVEFESLKKVYRSQTTQMFDSEIFELMDSIYESSGENCLKSKKRNWITTDQTLPRIRPYKDNCTEPPQKFFADAKGRKIYRLTDKQMEKLENRILENEAADSCLSPFIKF